MSRALPTPEHTLTPAQADAAVAHLRALIDADVAAERAAEIERRAHRWRGWDALWEGEA